MLSKFLYPKYLLIREKSLLLPHDSWPIACPRVRRNHRWLVWIPYWTCKINQNMDFGDIIYFLLLIAFMVLGFFSDARKRKKKEEELKRRGPVPLPSEQMEDDYLPPPSPMLPPIREFHSTLSPSDFSKYGSEATSSYDYNSFDNTRSSLSDASFSHLAGSSYIPDSPTLPDSPEMPVESRSRRTSDGKNRGDVHPLVAELHGENASNELRKGIIYSELLNRRY